MLKFAASPRRPIAASVCLLFLAAPMLAAQPFFPMAVWYGGGKARAPMLEPDPRAKKEIWRRDLRAIKSLGFNTVRCWMDWATGEPSEGVYQFDTIGVLLELTEQEGLKVIIQTYMDAAPDWVGRKYSDAFYVSIGGEVMRPESAPGYCFDHPGVRRAELAFFSALAERARRSPAFLGWDLWSEPHVINWADATYLKNAEFCYCPHTCARFRAWLEKKYGTLDALNQAWYRRFLSWDEIEPNRLSTILSYTDYIDWRSFITNKLAEDLRMKYDAVKRVAPDRMATSHADAPNLFTSPRSGDGTPDDWLMAHQVDFWGTSFYPKHSSPVGRDPAWRGALLDFTRSAGYSDGGHGWWIGELQGGFGTVALNVSATVTPEDLRVWTWSALARGAKGINFYAWYPMSSGYESGGFGLINLDGSVTERARAAGEIARVVDRNQKLFLEARPAAAEVAIVYNPLSYMVGGRERAASAVLGQGEVASIERDSMLGMYRALFPTNVPVDYIHIERLHGSIARYKLVLVPYPLMIPRDAASELADYVRNGGTLVSEARLAWNNERGRASEIIPGLGLDQVTGCRERAVQMTPTGRTELRWTANDIAGLKEGDPLPGTLYEETLEPSGSNARVAARFANGAPAAVISTFGRGKTLTLGSYIGVSYEHQQSAAAERLFNGLLDWAGVTRPVTVSGSEVEVRLLEAGGGRILVAFNHQDHAIEPVITLRDAYSGTDLMTGEPLPVSRSFRKHLEPGEVWPVHLIPSR
jgi:beta-galactosidase